MKSDFSGCWLQGHGDLGVYEWSVGSGPHPSIASVSAVCSARNSSLSLFFPSYLFFFSGTYRLQFQFLCRLLI